MLPSLRSPILALALALLLVGSAGCFNISGANKNGYGENWFSEMVQATALHDRGITGKGVKVAIIDTGIDLSNKEFNGVDVQWADLVNHRPAAYDDHGHGSHVAGIIVAQGTWSTFFSGFKLKGIAPSASLIVIKAMDSQGNGDESRVAQGITTATQAGADIIVLSLGGQTRVVFGTQTEDAVNRALSAGVFVVAAAGNLDKSKGETDCTIASPASVEGVIAVGAVDKNRKIADFSCHGTGKEGGGSVLPGIPSPVTNSKDPHKKPEVVAPGVDVTSVWTGGAYASASGTSQAAPMVGGVLALILEKHPELKRQSRATIDGVKDKIMVSSAKIGPLVGQGATAHDDSYGYGLIQADALLRALS